jgi:hypothetical protein
MGIETLAAISIGAAVVGGGVAAYGSAQAGKASKTAYTYQSQVAQNNKIIADRNAEYALQSGEVEGQIMGLKNRANMGNITVGQAASGLDINSGSALGVRESQAKIDSFEEMMIRDNSQRKAYAARVEGTNQESQAKVSAMAGEQAEKAGYIGAFSSLLGGASSVSDKWMKFKVAGVEGY